MHAFKQVFWKAKYLKKLHISEYLRWQACLWIGLILKA